MEINNSKNRLSRIIAVFIMFLLTMCLTMIQKMFKEDYKYVKANTNFCKSSYNSKW